MPQVSVVIPAYNPGPRLRTSLASVLAQSETDVEVLVVDDGGTEDLSWVEAVDERVTRIRQDNAGVSVARNVGIAAATAPLVAFLDQDDEWLPDKLASQLHVMTDDDMSVTDFWWCGTVRSRHQQEPLTYAYMLGLSHYCLSSLVVRRTALERVGLFDPLLRIQQDHDLMLRMLRDGSTCAIVSTPLVRYNLHDANGSRDYAAARSERRSVLARHIDDQRLSPALLTAARQGIAGADRLYGAQAFDAFRSSRRPSHLVRALLWSPRFTLRQVLTWCLHRGRRA